MLEWRRNLIDLAVRKEQKHEIHHSSNTGSLRGYHGGVLDLDLGI